MKKPLIYIFLILGVINIITNKENLINILNEKVSQLPQKSNEFIQEILNVFELIARVLAPVGTGLLRDSIQVFMGSTEGYVTSLLDYFPYVILGTPAHDIGSPVWIPQAGGWRYIGVSPAGRGKPHPGTKPNDFMADTFDSGMPEVDTRSDQFLAWIVE